MSLEHLKENAAATDFRLAEEDIDRIDGAFHREPIMVLADRIRVSGHDADETHIIYTTVDEAIKNAAGIQPSPATLAEEIRQGGLLKPVELVRTQDTSGRYDYDLIHGRNRYWAWIIAYGNQAPIAAYVANGTQHA
jgi:hypothetical protein